MLFKQHRIKNTIYNAESYLRKKILSGDYSLSCVNQSNIPMFSHNKGHLFSIFFMTQALKNKLPEDIRSIFISRILSEEYKGLWGYSPRGYYVEKEANPYFVDADDSAFTLRTLRYLDIYRDNGILDVFLKPCKELNGVNLYTTFKSPHNSFIENKQVDSNHFGFHPEVIANIYHLLLNTENEKNISTNYIRHTQQKNGQWPSFFYKNEYYSTCLFIDLLNHMNTEIESLNNGILFLKKSLDKLLEDNLSNASPYSISQILSTLSKFDNNDKLIKKGLKCLLAIQNKDGSWGNSDVFWSFNDKFGNTWMSYDVNKVIATSSCLNALKTLNSEIK
jgi:hypothetical protein